MGIDMRIFWLKRIKDKTGVSGTGIVAEGIEFTNGKCAVHWKSEFSSVTIYDSISVVERIHGHSGDTKLIFKLNKLDKESIGEKE